MGISDLMSMKGKESEITLSFFYVNAYIMNIWKSLW